MAKVGVVLSGCGFLDGSEIHESVLTLYFLDRAGAEIVCMAPNVDQMHVIDHLTQQETGEKRNVLVESARIARGAIKDIVQVQAGDIDALIIPGGYGAAKNLCNFAVKGPECSVNDQVARLVKEIHAAGKPIGAICIAPALIAKLFGDKGVVVTIGSDESTASAIQSMGAKHENQPVTNATFDASNKVVTCPAYMLGPSIAPVAEGIEKVVKKVLELAK